MRSAPAIALLLCACGSTPPSIAGAGQPGPDRDPPQLRCDDVPAAAVAPIGPPALVRFTATEIPPGPVGLARATAVWSGREHLIFGGASPSIPRAEGTTEERVTWRASPAGAAWEGPGWALDPGTGRWRTLPGAPIAGAQWNDPIAWHCGRVFELTSTGAGVRYDPITGDRTPTSADGAPTGCWGQRMHVRGPLAIVWGCSGCRGSVYDAREDRWTEMRTDGDPIAWPDRCQQAGVIGETFVVLRTYRGAAGGAYDLRTQRWSAIAEDGSPEQVLTPPVGDATHLAVIGTRGAIASVYRYDLAARAWSSTPLPQGVCSLGPEAALRSGVLIQAGGGAPAGATCGYDVAHGTIAATFAATPQDPAVVTSFGPDHVLTWASVEGTDEGHGEMPRVPTRWIENAGRVLRFEIAPAAP